MTKEKLTDFQLQKIAELRLKLGEKLLTQTPIFNDDFSMLRWLIGHDYKVDEIPTKFVKAGQILRSMNLMNLIIDDVDKLNAYVSGVTIAANYFPGGIMGFDAEGNVVSMQVTGKSHPKTLSHCGRVSDVFRLTIQETALVYQLQEQKTGKKLGLRVIIDLEEYNSDHFHSSTVKIYANTLKYLQNLFPEITRQVFIINAPTIVMAAYKVVKSVLSEKSRQKVNFLGSNYKKILLQEFGAKYLYAKWGGTKRPKCGNPETGLLRMGGPPPFEVRYNPKKNPEYVSNENLIMLNVPARNQREVEIDVPEGGSIHWYILTNGDIDFGIFDLNGIEEWPQFRIDTECVPEYGSVRCKSSGKHTVVFDNTFSIFFGKEVKFHLRVKSSK